MTSGERLTVMSLWNGIVVFGAVLYLDGAFMKALLLGLFFSISCLTGLGRRWLLPIGFGISAFAVAVALGFPVPSDWPDIARKVPKFIHEIRTTVSDLSPAPGSSSIHRTYLV